MAKVLASLYLKHHGNKDGMKWKKKESLTPLLLLLHNKRLLKQPFLGEEKEEGDGKMNDVYE